MREKDILSPSIHSNLNEMCMFIYFFIQVEAVGSVKNINIKNKNIN